MDTIKTGVLNFAVELSLPGRNGQMMLASEYPAGDLVMQDEDGNTIFSDGMVFSPNMDGWIRWFEHPACPIGWGWAFEEE